MAQWSDGRYRAAGLKVLEHHRSIVEYFEAAREEELLRLRWENEDMRRDLTMSTSAESDAVRSPQMAMGASAQ
jgi:hypothetical protein